jgi:RNA-splicing ligase RtcB
LQEVTDNLRSWASIVDEQTLEQARRTSRLPILGGPVCLMPDAHWGMGSTVGSVIPTENAIIPSAVGVDIGCGMVAVKTRLVAADLPDSLDLYLPQATRDVPAGVGQGHKEATKAWVDWVRTHPAPTKFSDKQWNRASTQFGSLGSGNHFYEVCLDEDDKVWLVLHSGSRGIGNELAQVHINQAKRLMQDAHAALEDPDLAYLAQGTPEFEAYIADMTWCQDYAFASRLAMVDAALRGFLRHVGWNGDQRPAADGVINCHHNYTVQEIHGGKTLWITRKGAISARSGELGVIPGSMGAQSYIVSGLGNPDSYMSCSHGAGRLMSRGQARRTITGADLTEAMGDRAWQRDDADSLVDEAPGAYKPIDQIMEDQQDLVRIEHALRQVFNYKGVDGGRRRRH